MSRLLFVTPYFPPTAGSGVQRGAKLVKYLVRLGWDVRVVTIDPSAYADRDEELAREVSGVRVDAVGLSRIPGVEHTILRALPGMRRALAQAMREHRPDVVLATTPDYHWALVAATARRHGVPFVLDYPDPWTVLPDDFRTFGEQRRLRSRLKWALAPRVERRLLARAAFATFATESMLREYVLSRSVSAARAHVLTNGYDEEDFVGVRSDPPTDRVVVAHVGSFGGRRTPLAAARAVAAAASRVPGIELSLIGAGVEPLVDELRLILGSIPLRTPGWVSHSEAVKAMSDANILWLDAMVHLRSAATGKLYEYLRAGRPILALAHPDSPAARLVRELDAGCVLGTDDATASADAIVALLADPPAGPDPSALAALSREAVAERLSRLLEGVTK
jgi:glycosyltransferase involved in cell wall biosynthesis